MYGHIDALSTLGAAPAAHSRLAGRTGGFTEFVPLPFVHMEAPIYLKGRARRGPTFREAVLMHAVARLALNPLIPNIQTSWVKMGPDGVALCLHGRRQRPRRHADGRDHHPRRRRDSRPGDDPGGDGGDHPRASDAVRASAPRPTDSRPRSVSAPRSTRVAARTWLTRARSLPSGRSSRQRRPAHGAKARPDPLPAQRIRIRCLLFQ